MYAAKVNDVEQLIHHMWLKLRNRGYYMAARRYEISLRVLKNISTREEKFRISKRPCNVLFII